MRMPLGAPHVDFSNLHTQNECQLGNTTQSRQLMEIPTHFKDEMEQTKLHSPQLVDVEVSNYPFFLNIKTEKSQSNYAKIESAGKNIQQDYRRCPFFQSPLDKRQ